MAVQKAFGVFGLRSVSAVMAGFCGLVGVALSLFLVFMTVGNGYAMVTQKPFNWSKASTMGSASLDVQSSLSWKCERQTCHRTSSLEPRAAAVMAAAQIGAAAPMAALAYGLLQACLCFASLARGQFLHRRTVSRLMRFAGCGLLFVLTSPFSGSLGRWTGLLVDSAFRVLGSEKSSTVISGFGLRTTGVNGVLTIIYAVTLTVIAVIMVKASTIADDHAQIV